jgi:hypothetical protein
MPASPKPNVIRRFIDLFSDLDTLVGIPAWFTWGRRLIVAAISAAGIGGIGRSVDAFPWSLVILVGLCSFLVVLVILNVVSDRGVTSIAEHSAQPAGWLLDIAKADLHGDGATISSVHADCDSVNNPIGPYIDFQIMIWNGCVWPISVQLPPQGKLKCEDVELPGALEVIRTTVPVLPHNRGTLLVLRQHLTKEAVDWLRSCAVGYSTWIDFEGLKITVIVDPDGAKTSKVLTHHKKDFVIPLQRSVTQ